MPFGHNQVLGDLNKAPEHRPHRVAIATWPTMIQDPRTASLEALIRHVKASGYEGFEATATRFRRFFEGESDQAIARRARREIEKAGLRVFGGTLHTSDAAMRTRTWLDDQIEGMKLIKEIGGEYASFQMSLPDEYLNTGGLYREDDRYLQWFAGHIADLRNAAWDLGLNYYNEVHVDRITEDPAACCRLLELATCELNGDLSHLHARGIQKGRYVEKIQKHMGHAHVRMARKYGDLSAGVEDPKADWEAKGVTWQAFEIHKGGLDGGLSSRTICGETGPLHLVTQTLDQDASLVPLYRAMARYADASAQGIAMDVSEPSDLRPWG